jgi:hypothetical protein
MALPSPVKTGYPVVVQPGFKRLTTSSTVQLCRCATCIGAVGILLACGQELGRKQEKAGRGAKNQRLNGLDLVGRGLIDGGSVDVDFLDDVLCSPYTPNRDAAFG